MAISLQPRAQGLYDPAREHDACGVAFVATLTGIPTHDIVVKALKALTNLEHRGASGSEPDSGDGAGILLQVPDLFLRKNVDFELPAAGGYAVGTAFFDQGQATLAMGALEELAFSEGLTVIGWRQVPTDDSMIGATAKACKPDFWQLFITDYVSTGIELDRAVYGFRKLAEHDLGVYFSSLSSRTLLYKGMLTTGQLSPFFPDLTDPLVHSALALVHSRFSTNTFPSWPLAHPYRLIAHNGEINTVRGNRNWMTAREAMLTSDILPGDMTRLFPICSPNASDSASFDEALELFHLGGRSLPHAVLMMIPEAWENNLDMSPARRAFYEFHATIMEPWDGPASVPFTDGDYIGAVLDRNGLRPGRFWVCDDGLVVLASEAGVLDIDPGTVVRKGRLQPGKMFLVDTAAGRVIEDEEIKESLAGEHPYQEWLMHELIHLEALPEREHIVHTRDSVARRQQTFGYTQEDLRLIIEPMAKSGTEAIGSMGTDTPIAALSDRPRMLFDYFSQLFAQVTNPPLDAIREEIVTSLGSIIGPEGNLLEALPGHCRQVVLPFPVIDNDDLAKILHINADGQLPEFAAARIKGLYNVYGGGSALEKRILEIFNEVDALIRQGKRFIVLSDRESNASLAPIPSLLLCAAVHHHLVRTKNRTMISLLIETGDVREVHHVALLIGYGAAAINPYLTLETVEDLVRRNVISDITPEKAMRNVIKSLGKGLLKVMSKMGVSTVASYRGAQIFEAIGLSQEFIDAYFTNTISQLGGIGIDEVAAENAARHADAYPVSGISPSHRTLRDGGEYQWRREGSPHLFDPETVFRLQHATRSKRLDIFSEYTGRVNDQSERLMTLRGLFEFNSERAEILLNQLRTSMILFKTGAMSYGSISKEAHENLAVAMNRIGGKSNSGEGGEDEDRFYKNGDLKRSAIKQVASWSIRSHERIFGKQ